MVVIRTEGLEEQRVMEEKAAVMEQGEKKETRRESKGESDMTESEVYSYNPNDKGNQSAWIKASRRILSVFKPVGLALRHFLIRFGEDWLFLFLLGTCMAIISFGLDVTIAKLQRLNLWVYDALNDYLYLQYFSWILYHMILMMVSAGVAKYISPQAAGSGIPEIKVTLRGVVLAEFFTFRTFIAKLIGVTCTLAAGSTIFLGKVGPFVHMATILATLLGKAMVKIVGAKENPGRKYELLIAGAAVGVACCFVAPVGGVLFSIEATATHFAVRNYWRGFFAATCAALTFRVLAVTQSENETIAILFSTNWRVEFPFDLPEYLSYALLGVVCGCVCCVYLFLHRVTLLFLNNNVRVGTLLRNNKIVYAALVSLILASITFPHGFGQYLGGTRLTMKEHLETFFNNVTWGLEELSYTNTSHQPPNPSYDNNFVQWTHPNMSSLEKLALFVVLKFFMLLFANTMIIPAGYFLPVFVYGAGLGRLYGEIMAKIFPEGIISEGIRIRITPAGYALAGAAAYSGAVTHTISTALLVFELTGQMSHILPVLIAVLIANAISQSFQNSFFDLIVIIKKLPYLPKLTMGKNSAHDIFAGDFMVTDLIYLVKGFKYKDVRNILKRPELRHYPIVDTEGSLQIFSPFIMDFISSINPFFLTPHYLSALISLFIPILPHLFPYRFSPLLFPFIHVSMYRLPCFHSSTCPGISSLVYVPPRVPGISSLVYVPPRVQVSPLLFTFLHKSRYLLSCLRSSTSPGISSLASFPQLVQVSPLVSITPRVQVSSCHGSENHQKCKTFSPLIKRFPLCVIPLIVTLPRFPQTPDLFSPLGLLRIILLSPGFPFPERPQCPEAQTSKPNRSVPFHGNRALFGDNLRNTISYYPLEA
uniref:Chloride channel protein n=2 Tax=Leptobrachium leishanense TaxID=445787 RepID=A0A8C5LXH3_9ANUR